jgi:hypothetical protein
VLLISFIVANRAVRGLLLVGLGLACDLVAFLVNGGLMPATRGALRAAGLSYHPQSNSISTAHPRLALLVDRWAAPH